MSKMGRHVLDIQLATEAEIYEHTDREACTNAQADQDSRTPTGSDGGGGFVCGANQREGSDLDTGVATKDIAVAEGSTPDEVFRRP